MLHSNYKDLDIKVRSNPGDKSLFPTVKQPRLVGDYSLSAIMNFENSGSRLRFLEQPLPSTCPFSLRTPGSAFGTLEDEEEQFLDPLYLDNMFYFLKSSTERFHMLLDVDIVCTRDVLELLMCSPYNRKKKWMIAVSKYRNTIYMCQVKDDVPGYDPEHLNKLIRDSWLKTLRQHCLKPRTGKFDPTEAEKECGQYYGVFSMEISGIRILFDAPVIADGSTNPIDGTSTKLVDLQLRLDTMSRAEWVVHNREQVLLWWVQCFLVGIEKIYIAYHDQDAIVHRIKDTSIRALWAECKDVWSPNLCANFLSRFLNTIKKLMAPVDNASIVYMFEYDAKNEKITYKVNEECNEHSFIPDWFRIMSDEPMNHLNGGTRYSLL